MATFSDYADEIAAVLDDYPEASPSVALGFEKSLVMAGDLAEVQVYRDWLKENACEKRLSMMDVRLRYELGMFQRLLADLRSRASEEVLISFTLTHVELLKRLLEGRKRTPASIRGVAIIRFPAGRTEEQVKLYKDMAKAIADNIRMGSVLALPNDRDDTGEYAWDFRIEGGDFNQVTVERHEE